VSERHLQVVPGEGRLFALARKHHRLHRDAKGFYFNTHEEHVMRWWVDHGCYAQPWYKNDELIFLNGGSRSTRQGWEIRVFPD
jgi:hypothetical protein